VGFFVFSTVNLTKKYLFFFRDSILQRTTS